MQNYFTKILEDDLKALIKPQYVDQIPKAVRGTVRQLLEKKNEKDNVAEICEMLGELHIWLFLMIILGVLQISSDVRIMFCRIRKNIRQINRRSIRRRIAKVCLRYGVHTERRYFHV